MNKSPEQFINHHPQLVEEKEKNIYDKEFIEGAFEAVLREAERIDEGANGVIAKIDLRKLSPSRVKEFLVGQIDIPNESAIKLLKVYKPGKAQKEFYAQTAAYKALEEEEDVAKIPKPYHSIEIDATSEIENILKMNLSFIDVPEKVGILIMDFVD